MKILDRVKVQAEQAAAKAKEGIEDVQAKRELRELYCDLGQEVFALHEQGEFPHAVVDDFAERIRAVKAKLETDEPAEEPADAPTP